ncbi:thioredoxin-like domain-containing protein [Ditylenchus destructor]|nr:thioredoxin-like domain-containing protein [Ditylenchus destructor]
MWTFAVILIFLLSSALAVEENDDQTKTSPDVSNGFGADIDWVEWQKAQSIALDLDKPIFFLIHKTWCGACKSLKQNFQTSNKRKELVEISSQFVMVNVEDDDEPEDKMYSPDGGYIPRLLFLNKHGVPLDVNNKKNYPKNAYYYPLVADIVKAMKQALKQYASSKDERPAETSEEEQGSTEKAEQDNNEKAKEDSAKATKAEEPKKSKTEKQPAEKQKKGSSDTEVKSKKNEENKDDSKETSDDKKDEEKPSGGCPHAAAAKAKAAKKEQEKKAKSESKEGKTENTKTKDTKKSAQQNKKSEL